MNALILLLVTLASLGGEPTRPAEPDATQKCISGTATILRRIETIVEADPSFELHGYSKDQAVQVLETFNADPPATQYRADQIMTIVDTREDGNKEALVMLFTGGCITDIVQTPAKNWRDVLGKSIGRNT